MNRQQIPGSFAKQGSSAERDVFRTLNGRPIHYRGQKTGIVHACEGADVHPDVRLLWTLCSIDVPADAAYLPDPPNEDPVTCPRCIAAANDGKTAGPEGSAQREARSEREEVNPCPFCGSPAAVEGPFVSCPSDDCSIEVSVTGINKSDAIRRWNRRSPLLSSPRVEGITAQGAIDEVENAFLAAANKDFELLRDIRKRLRALSPPVG